MFVVTGSHGFIGQHLCRALRSLGKIVYEIDLRNGRDILDCELPDADRVFHLAAQTDAYCRDAEYDARVNIVGSVRIFEKYQDKVVFTSSSMVNYPFNPYAISKLSCEHYARYYGAAIVRLPNVYGYGGHSFIDVCQRESTITVYGTGEQARSYQHINVVLYKLLHAMPGSMKIVPGEILTVNEIVEKYGSNKPVVHKEAREGDLLCAVQLGG
jgi:nucleoside-diphosphate-sugar epimerase